MTLPVFINKVLARIRYQSRCVWRYVPPKPLCSSLQGVVMDKTQLTDRFRLMLGAMVMDTSDRTAIKLIMESVRHTMDNEFCCLGSGWVKMSSVNWHVDIKNGGEWPAQSYYTGLRALTPQGADIKVPWELSRGHFLLWLGEAYLMTGEEQYAHKEVALIEDWIDHNPLMYSVAWTCAMDVAIRAVNWMYAIAMISGSKAYTEDFSSKVQRSLFQHGFFIRHNLEKGNPDSNNHYTSDLVGLLFLGKLFQHTRTGRKWYSFALSEFFDETRVQFFSSGIHYEHSVSYHRLMVELTAYPLYMLIRTGEQIPEDILTQVNNMHDYVRNYVKPNGMAPLVADNDDGRLLPFVPRDFKEHGYLVNPTSLENRIIANGLELLFKQQNPSSLLCGDANVAIYRAEGIYLFINGGGYSKHTPPVMKPYGTHTHNDFLSFELNVNGHDVFIDAGSGEYTSNVALHNQFRSTAKHNTAQVDGEEQNVLSATNAFVMQRNIAHYSPLRLEGSSYIGDYTTFLGQMRHIRSFTPSGQCLSIEDSFEKQGDSHTVSLFFHLAEDVKVLDIHTDYLLMSVGAEQIRLAVDCPNACAIDVSEDTFSPSYGCYRPTKVVCIKSNFDSSTKIITKITW